MMIIMRKDATEQDVLAVRSKIPNGYKYHIVNAKKAIISVEDLNKTSLEKDVFSNLPGFETVSELKVVSCSYLKDFDLSFPCRGL